MDATGRTVAANVKRLRAARGMSLRALSEALDGVGRKLSQDAINKIENGAEKDTAKQIRRVDVDDLIALAAVLRVNPSALMLPLTDDPSEMIEVTGAGRVGADQAWDWIDGRRPLRVERGDYDALLEFDLYARPPRRRRSWDVVKPLLPETSDDALLEELKREEPGDG